MEAGSPTKNSIQGHEYGFDLRNFTRTMMTFGIVQRPKGRVVRVPFPSIGYLEDETFQPAHWKPNLPNPAFDKMTDRDGYWAAKIVASFTDEQITAAVRTGKYSSRAAEKSLIEILEHRRDRIAKEWFRRVAPMDRFRFAKAGLMFDDLAVDSQLDSVSHVKYDVVLTSQKQSPRALELKPGMAIPVDVSNDSPIKARITRSSPGWPDSTIAIYLQKVRGMPTVVRIER